MARTMQVSALAFMTIGGAGAAFAQAPAAPLPQGQGANLTVHSAAPPAASAQPPAVAPFHFAGAATSSSGGISAGALSGPLGGATAATSCRPFVRRVVHRRVVRHATPELVVATPPPPRLVALYPVYAYRSVYAYRPIVVPVFPYGPRYGGYGYRGYGYRGYGPYVRAGY